MSRRLTYQDICSMIVARRCANSGYTPQQIAAQAKVSVSRVQRWLKATAGTKFDRPHRDTPQE